jgi:LacI family transcriptional regulator
MARITLQDIAKRAGVDRSTVSRVLSNKAAAGGISEELARKITAIAEELNYIPNHSARAVRMGCFNCAALLMSTDAGRSYLPSRLLDGVHDELSLADMHLTVAKVPDAQLNSDSYVPKILRALLADGLLINYTHHLPERLVTIVENRRIPAVWINTQKPTAAVYPDNRKAGRELTQKLLDLGHQRIAWVDFCHGPAELDSAHFSVAERRAGYEEAMRTAGLMPRTIMGATGDCSVEMVSRELTPVLKQADRPTALVCYYMLMTAPILRAAMELGLSVPRDLSVATFAADHYYEQGLAVSAMLEPHYQMGQEAARMLKQILTATREGSDQEKEAAGAKPSRVLDFRWQDLGSCARVG